MSQVRHTGNLSHAADPTGPAGEGTLGEVTGDAGDRKPGWRGILD